MTGGDGQASSIDIIITMPGVTKKIKNCCPSKKKSFKKVLTKDAKITPSVTFNVLWY